MCDDVMVSPGLIYDVKTAMHEKTDCMVQGYMHKQTSQFGVVSWSRRYYRLYPNRMEWSEDQHVPSVMVPVAGLVRVSHNLLFCPVEGV